MIFRPTYLVKPEKGFLRLDYLNKRHQRIFLTVVFPQINTQHY